MGVGPLTSPCWRHRDHMCAAAWLSACPVEGQRVQGGGRGDLSLCMLTDGVVQLQTLCVRWLFVRIAAAARWQAAGDSR